MNRSHGALLIAGVVAGFVIGGWTGYSRGFLKGEEQAAAESIYRQTDSALAIAAHLKANKIQFALDEAENDIRFGLRSIPQMPTIHIQGPLSERTNQILSDAQEYERLYLKNKAPFYPLRSPIRDVDLVQQEKLNQR